MWHSKSSRFATAVAFLTGVLGPAGAAGAQQSQVTLKPLGLLQASDATAGSPAERSYALLAMLARADVSPSLMPFDARTLDSIARASHGLAPRVHYGVSLTTPWQSAWHNTAQPRMDQDGAVWQGKGLTVAGGAGVLVRYPWFEFSAQPMIWGAQNADWGPVWPFPLAPGDYRNPVIFNLDTPYRFGDKSFGRLEPGQSWIRFGNYGASIGFTTAGQRWGPAFYHPLMMGTEGAGYPRVFVEAREANLKVARVTANWSIGRLESSGYDGKPPGDRSRFVPSLMVTVRPTWFPGLEFGATRLFHIRWTDSLTTWESALQPFAGLLKESNPNNEHMFRTHNQVASVFFSVAPGPAEVYGEFFREDHNWDMRDFVGEPDHASAYMIGLRRALSSERRKTLIVFEYVNARTTHIAKIRPQGYIYTHTPIQEGHSFRGQHLASSIAPGGGGFTLGVHRVATTHSSSAEIELRRGAQNLEGGSFNGTFTGSYIARYTRTALHGRLLRGFTFGLEQNYGLSDRLGGFVGVNLSRATLRPEGVDH